MCVTVFLFLIFWCEQLTKINNIWTWATSLCVILFNQVSKICDANDTRYSISNIDSVELSSIIWSHLSLKILIMFLGVLEGNLNFRLYFFLRTWLPVGILLTSCANQGGPAPTLVKAEVPWSVQRGNLSEKDRVLKAVKG